MVSAMAHEISDAVIAYNVTMIIINYYVIINSRHR